MAVSTEDSRSAPPPASAPVDEELRLPRPPGVIRRFWARHPLFADILIALICLFVSLVPVATVGIAAAAPWRAVAMQLITLVACALLVKRRRWPIIAFIASFVVAASYLLAMVPTGGPLVLVTSYTLAVYRSSRACWTGLGIGLGVLAALAGALASSGVTPFSVAINAIVGEGVMGLIGALIGVNVGNRKRYLEAVIDRSRQLLVERDQHAQLAAAAERDRIAREMHDIVSHSLTVVVALSEGAAATGDADRARSASIATAATARTALTEMRAMLGVLRDGASDAPLAPTKPVSPAETVDAARRAGFAASLATVGDADVPPPLAYAIGRIVQEGVTNAMRHAPHATEVAVRVDYGVDPIVVEVRNDGVGRGAGGGAAGGEGFGLRGIAERAALLGGRVHAGLSGDGRWMLRAELPAGGPASGSVSGVSAASGFRAGAGSSDGSGGSVREMDDRPRNGEGP